MKSIFNYAWALKIAFGIGWKVYRYRKDGYSKEEIMDILFYALESIGINSKRKDMPK